LALVPGSDQALGILKHLGFGCAPGRGFPLRYFAALILHLAAVEAHSSMLDCRTDLSGGTVSRPVRFPQ
jgi:hypothetical protein